MGLEEHMPGLGGIVQQCVLPTVVPGMLLREYDTILAENVTTIPNDGWRPVPQEGSAERRQFAKRYDAVTSAMLVSAGTAFATDHPVVGSVLGAVALLARGALAYSGVRARANTTYHRNEYFRSLAFKIDQERLASGFTVSD